MKNIYLITAVLILSSTFLFAQVTLKQADQLVQEYLKNKINPNDYWLYANDAVIKDLSIKTLINNSISVDNSSWVYFVDEQPFASWSHKCRYLFVNQKSGETTTKSETYPPQDLESWRMITELPSLPKGKKFDFSQNKTVLKSGLIPANCCRINSDRIYRVFLFRIGHSFYFFTCCI